MDEEWPNAIDIIQMDPSMARKRIIAHEFMGSSRTSEVLPIHLALSEADVPIELIQALVRAHPDSVRKTETGYERNCIHIALKSFASDAVVSYLIQLYPEACQMQDSLGRLPLHYSISNVHSLPLIQEVIHVYPEAVKAWDNKGWTPLMVACQTYSSPDLIRILLSIAPETILMTTKKGSTALGIAAAFEKNHSGAIVPILEEMEGFFRELPVIQNYRKAAGKEIYQTQYFYPRVRHNVV